MEKKLSDNLPEDYYFIDQPKRHIAKKIKQQLDNRKLSFRDLARLTNLHHPQIHRITSQANYNIDTLLKVLDKLGLEIVIKQK